MSNETGKIPGTQDTSPRSGQSSSQKQDRALIARVVECMPKLTIKDTQKLLGDSKLPARIRVALTPWSSSDKLSAPPTDCIPPLNSQLDIYHEIAERCFGGRDFLGQQIDYDEAKREIKEHKNNGSQLLLCNDFNDPTLTARRLLTYIEMKWLDMDTEHLIDVDETIVWLGLTESTIRLRTGDESEQVLELPRTKAAREHFDGSYIFNLTDHAPVRASNMMPVVSYRHVADMYDCMRLGVCEPLWFLAYFPEYLYWSGKMPLAYPGLDLGDLAVQGFGSAALDRQHGPWKGPEPDGYSVRMMEGMRGCFDDLPDNLDEALKGTDSGSKHKESYSESWQRAPFIYVQGNTLHVTSCGISGRFINRPSYTMMGQLCAGM